MSGLDKLGAEHCTETQPMAGSEQDGAHVSCACGDSYPANSYGAGFIDANDGVCEHCDAATKWDRVYMETHPTNDAINPGHYKVGGIETIDYMRAKATAEEFRGHLRLTALKYLSRVGHKDEALQEYRKAAWYLERLIKELEE